MSNKEGFENDIKKVFAGSGEIDKIGSLAKKEIEVSGSISPIALEAKELAYIASSLKTPSEQQGSDFKSSSCPPPCPNVCESDDYIRKDSIPCWNCNLPRNN